MFRFAFLLYNWLTFASIVTFATSLTALPSATILQN